MDKLKLDIQRFAPSPPTTGNLIDEDCLYEYHTQNQTMIDNKVAAKTGDLTNLTTTSKTNLVSATNELYDDIFYKTGDVYTTTNTIYIPAQITGGTATINFCIPMPKRCDNLSSATINTLSVVGRGTSGYLNNSSSYINMIGGSYTITTAFEQNMLLVQITKSSAFTNITNNTPLVLQIQGGFKVTFS